MTNATFHLLVALPVQARSPLNAVLLFPVTSPKRSLCQDNDGSASHWRDKVRENAGVSVSTVGNAIRSLAMRRNFSPRFFRR